MQWHFGLSRQSARHRTMLTGRRSLVVHAYLVATPSHHAHWSAKPHCACPPRRNAIASCSLVGETSLCMPTSPQCHRVMLTRVRKGSAHATSPQRHRIMLTGGRNLIVHAHLAVVRSCHALLVCETSSRMPIWLECDRVRPNCVYTVATSRFGPPNRRLQRTALRAHEIRAF
jgi:hypothetical protein